MHVTSHQSTANPSGFIKAAHTAGIYSESELGSEAGVLHLGVSVAECNNLEKTTSGDKRPLLCKHTDIRI